MEGSLQNVALAELPDTIGAPPSARLIESVKLQGIIQPVLLAEHTDDTGEIRVVTEEQPSGGSSAAEPEEARR